MGFGLANGPPNPGATRLAKPIALHLTVPRTPPPTPPPKRKPHHLGGRAAAGATRTETSFQSRYNVISKHCTALTERTSAHTGPEPARPPQEPQRPRKPSQLDLLRSPANPEMEPTGPPQEPHRPRNGMPPTSALMLELWE